MNDIAAIAPSGSERERQESAPTLIRRTADGIVWYEDAAMRERTGIVVAFSERTGGVSEPPFASLDLAAHTGDSPDAVDENRRRFLEALGLGGYRGRLTCAEQVHGTRVATVGPSEAGAGGRVVAGDAPLAGVDALLTAHEGVPLMLLFADCVPVVLVASGSQAIAVVHAGRRGLLGGVVANAVAELRDLAKPAEAVTAYIGPHIGACCYEVGEEVVSQFANKFVTIRRASATLDLRAAVEEELESSGVPRERQCHLGICTAHNTDRFYSYRAEGRTGRHAALACIVPSC